MRLFYSPAACSLSPHIVFRELGLDVKLERMDAKTHTISGGSDYYALNPKGSVPALELDDGQVLTEGAVIVQYLADLRPEAGLIPEAGTMARYRLQEWLNFIATDIHKQLSPLFNPKVNDEASCSAWAWWPSSSTASPTSWARPTASPTRTSSPSSGGPSASTST